MNTVDCFEIEITAGDAGLVCHDAEQRAGRFQLLQSFDNAGQEFEPIGISQVMLVDNDRPVAIEQNEERVSHRLTGWRG